MLQTQLYQDLSRWLAPKGGGDKKKSLITKINIVRAWDQSWAVSDDDFANKVDMHKPALILYNAWGGVRYQWIQKISKC